MLERSCPHPTPGSTESPPTKFINSVFFGGLQAHNCNSPFPAPCSRNVEKALDCNPTWDADLYEWKQATSNSGYRGQLREECNILTFVQDGLLTRLGGSPFGSTGFSMNCLSVIRLMSSFPCARCRDLLSSGRAFCVLDLANNGPVSVIDVTDLAKRRMNLVFHTQSQEVAELSEERAGGNESILGLRQSGACRRRTPPKSTRSLWQLPLRLPLNALTASRFTGSRLSRPVRPRRN